MLSKFVKDGNDDYKNTRKKEYQEHFNTKDYRLNYTACEIWK